MSVSCQFNGRLGNCLINIAQVISYCKQHNLSWFFPTYAWACINQRVSIQVPNTGEQPVNPQIYNEPVDSQGNPFYHEIVAMDNVEFRGYYQSFRYFDDYREQILKTINLPWSINSGVCGLHCRRGDCVSQPDGFPMVPIEYYIAAIRYMRDRGIDVFCIFSDDIPWCRGQFTSGNFPGCTFVFTEDDTDVGDFIELSCCEHQITARSTFSLMAGWFNQNPDKVVCCPSIEQHYYWRGQNRNLLDTNFLTQITW